MGHQQYTSHESDLAEMVRSSLFGFNARVAGPATLPTAAPPQSAPARPPYQQDEAAIQRGHAERRELLGQRRAAQQLTVLLTESQRLGVTLSTDAMARTCIAAYTDTMNCARR